MFSVKIPAIGESIAEATIGQWLKKDGSFVEKDEIICELESEKASFEQPAEVSGILHIKVEEGETVEIGALIAQIEEKEGSSIPSPKESSDTKIAKAAPTERIKEPTQNIKNYASPAAAKILSEKNLSPESIQGTGKDGRITKADAVHTSVPKPSVQEAKVADVPISPRPTEKKRMSTLRRTIAKRLVQAKNETAMLTTFNEVDMKPIMDIRKKYKESFKEKYEVGLGFMSFFTKAICLALKEWRDVNAIIEGDSVVYHNYCDISIAVSTEKGLVVPVIRNAETLNFSEIEKEIIRLAKRAREGILTIEEMTGGTFTITNGGIFGSMLSTPIINIPQSAILGMHNIVQRPVAINGEVVIRPIMYLALSYDHRIIDGRQSVSFLYQVKELLEDPTRLILEV